MNDKTILNISVSGDNNAKFYVFKSIKYAKTKL